MTIVNSDLYESHVLTALCLYSCPRPVFVLPFHLPRLLSYFVNPFFVCFLCGLKIFWNLNSFQKSDKGSVREWITQFLIRASTLRAMKERTRERTCTTMTKMELCQILLTLTIKTNISLKLAHTQRHGQRVTGIYIIIL